MTNSSTQTFFIAWHPEHPGRYYQTTLRHWKESCIEELQNFSIKDDPRTEIRAVHLVTSQKIQEMWDRINDLVQSHIDTPNEFYVDMYNLRAILNDILPEPKQ